MSNGNTFRVYLYHRNFSYDKNDILISKVWIGPKNFKIQVDSIDNKFFHFKSKGKNGNSLQFDRLVYNKQVSLNLFNGSTTINQGQILEHRTYYNDKMLIDFQEEYLDGKFLSRKLFEYF